MCANAGWPTGRESQGYRTPIVGSANKHERRGSLPKETRACPLIKAGRVGIGKFYTGGMRNAERRNVSRAYPRARQKGFASGTGLQTAIQPRPLPHGLWNIGTKAR
jgi:hypothetical protein